MMEYYILNIISNFQLFFINLYETKISEIHHSFFYLHDENDIYCTMRHNKQRHIKICMLL